jgi:hypothetical protein
MLRPLDGSWCSPDMARADAAADAAVATTRVTPQ